MAFFMQLALLQHILVFLLMLPSPAESKPLLAQGGALVSITNNHTKILTVRCFGFYDENTTRTRRMHLKPNEGYSFNVTPHRFFPSSTMYNCSTNMGVFMAYRYRDNCTLKPFKVCEWKFDETQTYRKTDSGTWEAIDYNPNYESLGRGGVVKGYFTN
ncbi:OLC1v1031066C1 [Oldenlandia corymbosa var. corymbosa]|uniref:OLC1v1031066C1 n=1 Tax=Oldenlandia corymbosa var. corymbosa TaxID=529605 RepID=A0AAV1CIB6_OLDCO|nr:OLC1v1031066C1 [Oldenlandia corymbosa var. corymbosa]